MAYTRRALPAIVGLCLLAAAACGAGNDAPTSATGPTPTASMSDDDRERSATPDLNATTAGTDPTPTSTPSTAEPPARSSSEAEPLDVEFQSIQPGHYRVETVGAPFTITVPEGWRVQYNSLAHFVITDEDSRGPGDREIQIIRPSNLADPDRPGAPVDQQTGDWPLGDIDGWIDALLPGIITGEPSDGTVGGLEAVRFDVEIADDVECGDGACVGFATNRLVNGIGFERWSRHRVWWIDGGDRSPVAIVVGDGGDDEFLERAQALLDTMSFESIGPNPIPRNGNLWELGFPSDVPTGRVSLPVGPGVSLELTEPRFVQQRDDFKARILLDEPGEVDIFFPDQASDGAPLVTVDNVIAAFERHPDQTATVVGTRFAGGHQATEVEFASSAASGPDGPVPTLTSSAVPGVGWIAPPEAILWIMESPAGLAVVSAEWFDDAAREPSQALAAGILDSIDFGG